MEFNDAFGSAPVDNDEVVDFLRKEQEALGADAAAFDEATENPESAAPLSADNPFFGESAPTADNADLGLDDAPEDEENPFYVSQQPEYEDPYKALTQEVATPSPIVEWREKRDKMLEAKDKASKEKNAAIEQEAKRAYEKFREEYKAKKESQAKKNRDQQKAFIAGRDTPAKGNAWERVYNLVDLNPKGQKSAKDVSRMRSILTQLKAAPNAPGTAA
jgi:hypothetical protein